MCAATVNQAKDEKTNVCNIQLSFRVTEMDKKNVSGMFVYGTDFRKTFMPNITVISLLNTNFV